MSPMGALGKKRNGLLIAADASPKVARDQSADVPNQSLITSGLSHVHHSLLYVQDSVEFFDFCTYNSEW
jgi:hypothetical protein